MGGPRVLPQSCTNPTKLVSFLLGFPIFTNDQTHRVVEQGTGPGGVDLQTSMHIRGITTMKRRQSQPCKDHLRGMRESKRGTKRKRSISYRISPHNSKQSN